MRQLIAFAICFLSLAAGGNGMPPAIGTNMVAAFADGLVTAEVDWNQNTGVLISGRVINNSDYPAYLWVELDPPISGWSTVGLTAPAHETTEANWPNNVVRYTKVIDPDDGSESWSLLGVSIFCRWPSQ